ncbi:MAG: SGNH/GDSL hydrolase family protein, partial [Planctomycetales bacterium]
QGFSGVTVETSYVSRLRAYLMEAELDVELFSSALEGIDTSYAVRRFNRMVTAHEPDLVLIMLGLNDAQPPSSRPPAAPEQYQQNLLGLIDRVLAIEARPLLACPSPRFSLDALDMAGENIMAPYAAAARQAADHYQIPCLDVFSHLMEHGDLSQLIPDGVHPQAEGHRLIADLFAESLIPMLGGRSIVPTENQANHQPASTVSHAANNEN